MNRSKSNLIVICGPTASGKTGVAIELCKEVKGEVVSADSMQIYRDMDIGTAKPDETEKQGITHHLIDIADPSERYSAAAYREKAIEGLGAIEQRNHIPILCGGTGLYIDAITKPMSFSRQSDPEIRTQLEYIASSEGGKLLLHTMLAEIDPESAARLHVNDVRRVVRAIEVFRLTGKTMTEQAREDARREGGIPATLYAIDWPREILYERIDRRVDEMIERGLISEVETLLERGLSDQSTAMQALGYKEIVSFLRGECAQEEAIEQIKRRTRNYAKRQLTWFRRDERTVWIPAVGKSVQDISREIRKAHGMRQRLGE